MTKDQLAPRETVTNPNKSEYELAEEFKNTPASFSCLGMGCIGWIIIMLAASLVYFYLKDKGIV